MTKQDLSPEQVYADLHYAIGGRLFTVTVLDRKSGLARRVYTSHPATYPVSGTKPMAQGDWTAQVVERGEIFVANTVAEFAIYFPDYEVIKGLGCASALNIPIKNGDVIGTVNILDVEGYFNQDCVKKCLKVIETHKAEIVAAMSKFGVG
jgi:hypothetical protein